MTVQNDFYIANGAPGLAVSQFFTGVTPTQARFEAYDAGGVKLVGIVENVTLGAVGFSPNDQLV